MKKVLQPELRLQDDSSFGCVVRFCDLADLAESGGSTVLAFPLCTLAGFWRKPLALSS
jgi:hypothetical protein